MSTTTASNTCTTSRQMESDNIEVLLAQKLSCGEPRIRKKAFFRLEQRINAQSVKKLQAAKEDFLKIWKGLYYCFWLQDKPLLQEELVDNIAKLLDSVKDKEQKLLFLECFYEEIGKEWYTVDQWRMDKFLMFYRRMFRRTLAWLKRGKFDRQHVNEVLALLRKFVLNSAENYPVGLKLHFVSIYMDELDNAGAGILSTRQSFDFLRPFLEILGEKFTSDVLFTAILNDVFKSVLEYCAENPTNFDPSSSSPVLQLDLPRIKDSLFELGKSNDVTSRRRALLYALVEKFDLLISGVDPFCEEISDAEDLEESDIDQAACDLVKSESSSKKSKNVALKRKRRGPIRSDDGMRFVNNNSATKERRKTQGKETKTGGKKMKNKFKRVVLTRV